MSRLLAIFACFSAIALASVQRRDVEAVAGAVKVLFDPTIRDWTKKCGDLAQFSGENYCTVFEFCCTHDPLNGDKCQTSDRVCVYDPEMKKVKESKCILSNCTEIVTTTPPPTTTTSRQTKGADRLNSMLASVFSLWLILV